MTKKKTEEEKERSEKPQDTQDTQDTIIEEAPATEEAPAPNRDIPSEPAETADFRDQVEITPEQLLADIREQARAGSMPGEKDETARTDDDTAWKTEWQEEAPEELEHDLSEGAAENAKQTAKLLVEMLDGVTVSITAAIAGVETRQAEKLWAFTPREKRQIYLAALPVARKYGVELPCEVMLALVIVQVEAPRLLQAQAIRKKRAASQVADETADAGNEQDEENAWSELL